MKESFYDDLQHALNEIPLRDPYILLSDLNARLGSRLGGDEDQHVRGLLLWARLMMLDESF